MFKRCFSCKELKAPSEFPVIKGKKGTKRLYSYCFTCDNAKQRAAHRKKRGDDFKEPPPEVPLGYKWCACCSTAKLLKDFRAAAAQSESSSLCKECARRSDRKTYLKKAYGLSPTDYESMLKRQNGVCAICHLPETVVHFGKIPNLSVDHDHETGRVRGLLCYRCNHLVGFIERFGSEGVDNVYQYLAEHELAAILAQSNEG